jgi:hypothetical protein
VVGHEIPRARNAGHRQLRDRRQPDRRHAPDPRQAMARGPRGRE